MKYLGWVVSFFLILFIFLIFVRNRNRNDSECRKVRYSPEKYTFNIKIDSNQIIEIGVIGNKLKYFSNTTKNTDFKQGLYFFENGMLQSKLLQNSLDQVEGQAVYFFKNTGCLDATFSFVNNIKTGVAISYFDSTNHKKEEMHYNYGGELFYKKTFNKQGDLIKTEGKEDY